MISTYLRNVPLQVRQEKPIYKTRQIRKSLSKILLALTFLVYSFSSHSQTVSISATVSSVVEGGTALGFLISLDNGAVNNTGNDITGFLTFSGTATAGSDYIGSALGTFAIPNGSSSTGILVPIIDDVLVEPTETVIGTISNLNVGTIGNGTATGVIIDDDGGATFLISIGSPVDGTEGSSDVTFDVFIEGGGVNTTGTAITGSISYSGSASSGDYVPANSFSIPAGANSTTVTCSVIDDALLESTETVIAQLTGSPSIGSYANSTSTANILDDDSQNLTISISSVVSAVVEGPTTFITYDISLDAGAVNNTGTDITGSISFSGSASPGGDYVAVSNFSIPDGASSTQINVTVIDDLLIESTETVIATISALSIGAVSPTSGSSTVNIIDDDAGSLLISIGPLTDGVEGSSDVTFEVFLEGGQVNTTGFPITGMISYPGGTAVAGSDYVAVNNFSIPNGANSTTITLTVIDDPIVEPTETVTPVLTGSPSTGSYANTTITSLITDDDAVNLTLSIGSPTDGTEGSTFVSYIVSIDGGVINNTGTPITGSISYGGTATDGVDYTGPASFSIPDGVGSVLVVVPVLDDLFIECDETVIATISSPSVGTISPLSSSTATIIDDECSQPQSGISIEVLSDGSEGGSSVSFNVFLENGVTNSTGSSITGSIAFTGMAMAGSDYSSPTTTFSIANGANSTIIDIPVVDDVCIEYTEDVIATISNPSAGSINIATDTAYITDDDNANMLISIGAPVDGAENPSNDVSFTITIDNGLTNCTGSAIFGDIVLTGTATEGADYTGVTTFSIPDGAAFATITLPVIDDAIIDCDETVIATIGNVSIGAISTNDTATAMIEDDECTNSIYPLNDLGLEVYPNPTSSVLNLSSENHMKSYSIIDLNGRVVDFGNIESTEATLPTDRLSTGSYLVEVQLENGTTVRKKILKE